MAYIDTDGIADPGGSRFHLNTLFLKASSQWRGSFILTLRPECSNILFITRVEIIYDEDDKAVTSGKAIRLMMELSDLETHQKKRRPDFPILE